jgi:hypothetical protein
MLKTEDFQALEDLEEHWALAERRNVPDPELWRWSPGNFGEFSYMLALASPLAIIHMPDPMAKVTFFEPGCGIGTKLKLAQDGYGLAASGIEINRDYLAVCRQLSVTAARFDLRAYRAIRWGQFDIVYTSRPFKDDRLNASFERYVQDTMRPGAVLIAEFCGVKPYTWHCAYRRPWRGVWRKPLP